jgi:glycosyltransferase involved in cell wall biosynthesis
MKEKMTTVPSSPMVSVCVLAYQHAPYIRECLDSILMQQTSFPIEILIGEDESTDGTREICQEYAAQHPDRIRLFLRSRKDVIFVAGKPTGRFNFVETIRATQGKYIALCDGDDYWTDPLKLQKQVDYMETHPECVGCHHWHRYAISSEAGVYEECEAPTEHQGYWPEPIATSQDIFANRLRIKTRTHLFRNIIGEFPSWFYTVAFGDVPLTMILGKHGYFGFMNEVMAVYRQTGHGASSVGAKQANSRQKQCLKWIEIWEEGLLYYQYQYAPEACATMVHYYTLILNHSQNPLGLAPLLFTRIAIKSPLAWRIKAKLLLQVGRRYIDKVITSARLAFKKRLSPS